MTTRLFLDYETASECDLKVRGVHNYAFHPSTTIIGAAFSVEGCVPEYWPGPQDPEYLRDQRFGADTFADMLFEDCDEIWAHNAEFDYLITCLCLTRPMPGDQAREYQKYLLSDQFRSKWRCTNVLARTCGLAESLEKLAIALDLTHHKDLTGRYLIEQLSILPHKEPPNPVLYRQMEQYALQDVRVLMEIQKSLPDLPPQEWALYHETLLMNLRGIEVDKAFCSFAVKTAQVEVDRLTSQALEVGGQAFETLNQIDKVKTWVNAQGVPIKSLDKFEVGKALADPDLPAGVRTVLLARQECGRASVQKFQKAFDRAGVHDRLRGELQYYGAQTGRWSSRGVQLQNIVRGQIPEMEKLVETLMDDTYWFYWDKPLLTLLSWAIRGMLQAKSGHKLVAVDYSSVEARGVLWLSKCAAGMAALSSGTDIYKVMASQIYNKPVENIVKSERDVGKQAVLGLGYGMGAAKFIDSCLKKAGIRISPERAQKAVNAYRTTFLEVPRFWYALEGAARTTITQGKVTQVQDTPFRFRRDKDFLYLRYPSGREGRFFKPGVDAEGGLIYVAYSVRGRGTESLYGGKLMENAVSGMCRDIMALALLAVEKAGYCPVLQVHDEIVCEVPEIVHMKEIEQCILSAVPEWATGFPIGEEAWEGKRYRK